MKRPLIILCISLVLLSQATSVLAASLTIAIAANVRFAFKDLQAAFTRETGIEIHPVFGSSGKLAAQVRNGAPFDMFLAADMRYPQILYKEGLASAEPIVYGYGALVVWTVTDLELTPELKELADPKVGKIAIANPKLAPYGRAALEALRHYQMVDAVEAKLVFGENVSQVSQFIYSRNVDAGFTAKSVVLSPEMRGMGNWIEVPKDSYQLIAQGMVILKHGKENAPADCTRFLHFLTSAPARKILANFGYSLP